MNQEILTRIKTILNVDESKMIVISELARIQYEALLARLNQEVIGTELEFIVVETTIARYNRLGSEGLSSEGIDVIKQDFQEDLFAPYTSMIVEYNKKHRKAKFV